jgi:hypothetical protein
LFLYIINQGFGPYSTISWGQQIPKDFTRTHFLSEKDAPVASLLVSELLKPHLDEYPGLSIAWWIVNRH